MSPSIRLALTGLLPVGLALTGVGCSPAPGTSAAIPSTPSGLSTMRQAVVHPFSPPLAPDLDPADDVVRVTLTAQKVGDTFTYNGLSPGPTIAAKLGDTVIVEFTNQLPEPSTIHWHGLAVPWEMDGHAWMMEPVAAGGTFRYEFVVNQAGTFWYHPHFHPDEQHSGGMYGAFVVADPAEPVVDEELVLILSSGEAAHAMLAASGEKKDDHTGGGGQLVPTWLVNGQSTPDIPLRGGSVVRLRTINVSAMEYVDLRWAGMVQIASDQGLLAAALEPAAVLLAPSDRADFVVLPGADALELRHLPYSRHGGSMGGDELPLARLTVESAAASATPPAWPFPALVQSPGPAYADYTLTITGTDRTGHWFFNGRKFPDLAFPEFPVGSRPIIEVRNVSDTEHPFHIHGTPFEVVSINGAAPDRVMIEDTINLRIRDVVRLRWHADLPGQWMAHCHILDHITEGLMTIFVVTP